MSAQAYEVVRLDENSWRIEENGVRCFLFAGRDFALLVDSGFGTGDLRAVVAGITPLPVKLVNTHADGDHIGCNAQFEVAHMHPAEYDRYRDKGAAGAPPEPLWEGDILDLGTRRFEVVLIPGHTPGSIALLDGENRVLIGGDSVQSSNIFMFGPGRSLPAYLASMEKLAGLRHRFDTVYPSHGDFPVPAGIVEGLADGARRVLAGEVESRPATFKGIQARLYPVGVAGFLCDD